MTIREIFDEAVKTKDGKTFLRSHDGSAWRTISYRETENFAIRSLAALFRLGLGDKRENGYPMRVAIMRENCPEWIITYLAVAGSGFIVVPVDPKLTTDEARHILTDCGAEIVIVDDRLEATVTATEIGAKIVTASKFAALEAGVAEGEVAAAREFWSAHRPETDDIASIVYTSGTTGKPKGAMLTHGNFTSNADQTFARVMFYDSDHYILVLPLFHAYAFTLSFVCPLRKMAEISFARSMRSLPIDMAELKPTVLMTVPLLAEMLYAHARQVISALRVLGVGGAPISKATLNGLIEAGVYVLEGYGITECAPGVSYPDEHKYVAGTVGTPLDGMEWRIVNSDETGAGELRVKGPNVMKGYWNNPEETDKAFDEYGFYRTGDIVRTGMNGNFSVCGRIKALIVNREGKNIYPEEIERAISRCPLVQDVVVIGYRVGGQVGEHVGVIVVPNPDAVVAEFGEGRPNEEIAKLVRSRVQALCHEALTEYKLPRKIEVRFTRLDRTPSMKIKRFVYSRALDE